MTAVRVLIADDDPQFLETIADVLTARDDVDLVGVAGGAEDAISMAQSRRPDVALIDARMPEGGGARAIREIRQSSPDVHVVALSAYREPEVVVEMLRAGAVGYLTKGTSVEHVHDAIQAAARGVAILDPEVTVEVVKELLAAEARSRQEEEERRREVTNRIRGVIAGDRLVMMFQPILHLITGRLVGVEALARFVSEHRQRPDAWFAEARAVGLGLELEMAAIRAAFGCLDRLPEHLFVSVNLSPDTACSDELMQALDAVEPWRVVIEVTEHAAVEDYERLNWALGKLRVLGVRVAIDDVGAGYATLRHLLHLAPDFVKLDRALCRHLAGAPGRALVGGVVSFAAEVGAKVVAEGIETHDELERVREAGIEFGQGFFFGCPEALIQGPSSGTGPTFSRRDSDSPDPSASRAPGRSRPG